MKVYGDPAKFVRKGEYHPMGEYSKAKKRFEYAQHNPGGRFHKLAQKIEKTLPRGLREKSEPDMLTTTILLEVINEEKQAI